MIVVGVANVFLLVCVVWVVWERRLTFGSRFDSPITIGTVLFGAGVGLTSPSSSEAPGSQILPTPPGNGRL